MESAGLSTTHMIIKQTPTQDQGRVKTIAYSFDPPAKIRNLAGELFIFIESTEPSSNELIQILIKDAGRAFYSRPETDPEARFRLCLRALNERLEVASADVGIGLIAFHNGRLFHSSTGSAIIAFIRGSNIESVQKNDEKRLKAPLQNKPLAGDKVFMMSKSFFNAIGKGNLLKISPYGESDFNRLLSKLLDPDSSERQSLIRVAVVTSSPTAKPDKPNSSSTNKAGLLNKLTNSARIILARMGSFFKSFIKRAKSRHLPRFLAKSKQFWINFWTKYVNPNPRKAFIVVVIATIIIAILIISIFSNIKPSKSPEKTLENARALISSAEGSQNPNNPNAQASLDKARSLLEDIPKKDRINLMEQYKQKRIKVSFDEELAKLKALSDNLQSITRIGYQDSFELGANLASLNYVGGRLLGIDKSDGSVLEINPLFGKPKAKASAVELKSIISTASFNDSSLIMLTDSGLYQFDPGNNLSKLNSQGLPSSSSIATYLNNVYLLSPSDNQVFRYTKSGNNLVSKTSMIKNIASSTLSGTSSIVVYNSIFVPKNRSILLFEQNEESNFKLNDLPESFGNIKSLTYNPAKNSFLALNSNSDKIAVLALESNSAVFKKSFALQDDAKISSFTIDDKTSQIFVNSGSKIISFNLEK